MTIKFDWGIKSIFLVQLVLFACSQLKIADLSNKFNYYIATDVARLALALALAELYCSDRLLA